MKLLRNPVVTGILAVVAVLFVGYQVLSSTHRGGGSWFSRSAPPANVGPPSSVGPASSPLLAPLIQLASGSAKPKRAPGIQREYVLLNFKGWTRVSQRDPFLLREGARPKKVAKEEASPLPQWKLKLIYRQNVPDDGEVRIAYINDAIYHEGDVIMGYRIIKIEEDTVWFQSPDSREHLNFKGRSPAPQPKTKGSTNAPYAPQLEAPLRPGS